MPEERMSGEAEERSDPPPPVDGPKSRGSEEPTPRFRLIVALLIAAVSLAGAGVAWSASIAFIRSSDLDQQALQEFLLRQQILTNGRAVVGEELRRLSTFQEQIQSQRILSEQAERFRESQPDVAAILDAQAQGEAALARTTAYYFFAAFPQVGPDGTVTYDREQALNNLLSRYVIYQQLHPEETAAEADRADAKARKVIGIGVVFVAALFFLTLAQLARSRIRYPFAGLGTLALVAGSVLLVLVETSKL